jgi:hypothetical protein
MTIDTIIQTSLYFLALINPASKVLILSSALPPMSALLAAQDNKDAYSLNRLVWLRLPSHESAVRTAFIKQAAEIMTAHPVCHSFSSSALPYFCTSVLAISSSFSSPLFPDDEESSA